MTDNPTEIVVTSVDRGPFVLFMKRLVQVAFLLLAFPRLITYFAGRSIVGRRALLSSSESIACVPGMRGVYLRQAFYRFCLEGFGKDNFIGWGTLFSMPEASIGNRSYIGRQCSIGYAVIGDEAMLADGVQVLSGGQEHSHELGEPIQSQAQCFQQVKIGDGSWIGAGAVVMADVGANSIVGAGAVVTRPIPDNAVAVGVPAKVIKTRGKDCLTTTQIQDDLQPSPRREPELTTPMPKMEAATCAE